MSLRQVAIALGSVVAFGVLFPSLGLVAAVAKLIGVASLAQKTDVPVGFSFNDFEQLALIACDPQFIMSPSIARSLT